MHWSRRGSSLSTTMNVMTNDSKFQMQWADVSPNIPLFCSLFVSSARINNNNEKKNRILSIKKAKKTQSMVNENVVKNAQTKRFKRLPPLQWYGRQFTVFASAYCHTSTNTHAEWTKEISTGFGLLFTEFRAFTFHVEVKSLRQSMIPFGRSSCGTRTITSKTCDLRDRNIVGKWMPHTTDYFCCHRRCRSRKCGDDRHFYRKSLHSTLQRWIEALSLDVTNARLCVCARVTSTTHHIVQRMEC